MGAACSVALPPEQTDVTELDTVISGLGFTVIVKGTVAETQPEVLFRTVRLKSYVPTGVLAGSVMLIGLPLNEALVTAVKPATALVPEVMLY